MCAWTAAAALALSALLAFVVFRVSPMSVSVSSLVIDRKQGKRGAFIRPHKNAVHGAREDVEVEVA